MKCPECEHVKTCIVKEYLSPLGVVVFRIRECQKCKTKFETTETVAFYNERNKGFKGVQMRLLY